jgi:hypothetical protein
MASSCALVVTGRLTVAGLPLLAPAPWPQMITEAVIVTG